MMTPTSIAAMWQAVANHLWQSTLFAVIAGLLTLALRRNRAQTRYWLWFAASVKFLIPFSLLVSLGSHLAWPRSPIQTQPGFYFAVDQVSQPFTYPATSAISGAASSTAHLSLIHLLPAILAAVWLCGFLAVLSMWCVRWRRISLLLRDALPLRAGRELEALRRMERAVGMRKPIELLLSPASLEPGIFGIARPVLLWPEGISERLQDAHLEAILAHEICHVRRRDNLTAAMHMVVEAVFWFHPLVWWLGARLVEERERACDEEVLQLGNRPQVYAESILKTCEYCLESPLACVSGVTGADLKKRVVNIMTGRLGTRLDLARKMLLAAAALLAVGTPLGFGLLHAMQARAQLLRATGTPLPSFEVATIKPAKPEETGLWIALAPAHFATKHSSLRDLIKFAYYMKSDDQLVGGSSWMNTEFFDVEAKAGASDVKPLTKLNYEQEFDKSRLMLQSLLAERFQLKVSFKTQEIPVYALVVAKGGSKLKEAAVSNLPGFGKTGPNQFTATEIPMSMLVDWLSGRDELGNRVVMDETGLKGNYDFVLNGIKVAPPPLSGANAPPPDDSVTSIFTVLQEQLGLKLESRKAPVEVLLVDHAEQPSPN